MTAMNTSGHCITADALTKNLQEGIGNLSSLICDSALIDVVVINLEEVQVENHY